MYKKIKIIIIGSCFVLNGLYLQARDNDSLIAGSLFAVTAIGMTMKSSYQQVLTEKQKNNRDNLESLNIHFKDLQNQRQNERLHAAKQQALAIEKQRSIDALTRRSAEQQRAAQQLQQAPMNSASQAAAVQVSPSTAQFTLQDKNPFYDFSDPLFTDLHNNPNLGFNQKNGKTFLDSALDTTKDDFKVGAQSRQKIIEQWTIQPNYQDNYWKKCIQPKKPKTIVIVYVHGTYSQQLRDTSLESMATEHESQITTFAQQLALAEQANVKIIYFKWSGGALLSDRQTAGKDLASILSNSPADQLITLSHSHGGNVVFHAADNLKLHEKTIHQAVLLGCPALDQGLNPHNNNIGNIVNIYGDADFVGSVGSLANTVNLLQKNSPITTSLRKIMDNAVNIKLKIQGDDLQHRETVPRGIENLPTIFRLLNGEYAHCHEVIVNIHDKNHNRSPFPDYEIMGCLDDNYHHPHSEISNFNATKFAQKYKKSIHATSSIYDKYNKEWAPHSKLGFVGTWCASAMSTLEHNPIESSLKSQINNITAEPDTAKKILLLEQVRINLFKMDHIDPLTIEITLKRDKNYNQLKLQLEDLASKDLSIQHRVEELRKTAIKTVAANNGWFSNIF